MEIDEKIKCERCERLMDRANFYRTREGKVDTVCKKCITAHIDNFEPATFTWILERYNYPYIPSEWNTLRDRAYQREGRRMNGMSVLGKYIGKMKLVQYNNLTWKDSEQAIEEAELRKQKEDFAFKQYEKEIQKKYNAGEISEAEYRTMIGTKAQREQDQIVDQYAAMPIPKEISHSASGLIASNGKVDLEKELTQEDRIYLAMKWGKLYTPSEWIELEKHYNDMSQFFKIDDPDTMNTLILISKTYLKLNQAIDAGDVESYQKLSRVYESLRKSGNFTALQNKDTKNSKFNSAGEIVAFCEKKGFIPEYVTNIPQDKVDYTIKDIKGYLKKLVTEDLGFGQQIEDAVKMLQARAEADEEEELLEEDPIKEVEQQIQDEQVEE